VHSVALEADKKAYFGVGKWNAGDASHTYIVQYHDGGVVHVLHPHNKVDYAGRGAEMLRGQWSVDKVVKIMCYEGSKCRSGTVHIGGEDHEEHWHAVHLSDVGVPEAQVSADNFTWSCPDCIAAAQGRTIAADVSMCEESEDVTMLEGSDGGGGAAAGQKHSMVETQRPRECKVPKLLAPRKQDLEAWERKFAALVAYAEKHDDDPNCPQKYQVTTAASTKPLRLGRWLDTQRTAFAADTLGETRKQRLTQLGVRWSVQYRDRAAAASAQKAAEKAERDAQTKAKAEFDAWRAQKMAAEKAVRTEKAAKKAAAMAQRGWPTSKLNPTMKQWARQDGAKMDAGLIDSVSRRDVDCDHPLHGLKACAIGARPGNILAQQRRNVFYKDMIYRGKGRWPWQRRAHAPPPAGLASASASASASTPPSV
jgi:hypothetical protein